MIEPLLVCPQAYALLANDSLRLSQRWLSRKLAAGRAKILPQFCRDKA